MKKTTPFRGFSLYIMAFEHKLSTKGLEEQIHNTTEKI